MKQRSYNLEQKLWLVVLTILFLAIINSAFLSRLYYENIYVDTVKNLLMKQAEHLAGYYDGGELTEEFTEMAGPTVSFISDSDNMVVDDLKKLNDMLPSLPEDAETILGNGETVQIREFYKGSSKEFMAVLYPLHDNDGLRGIICSHSPMESSDEFVEQLTISSSMIGVIFTIIALFFGYKVIDYLVKPLKEMKTAALKVSNGDYSIILEESASDEIGSLTRAFNKMSAAIREEDQRKRDFIADLSHELRTPLTYIKGYTEAMINGVAAPENTMKYLEIIRKESIRMQKLVHDLLELTKLEANTMEIKLTPVVFEQAVLDSLVKYEKIFIFKQLNCIMDLDPELIIHADMDRFEQIIENIIENAIRYTGSGGKIMIRSMRQQNLAVLEIQDTGQGISKEHLSRITERFYRVNKARSRSDGGTGIGMSIVQKLVNRHNGFMEIESEINVGTTVRLCFPIADSD